MSDPTGTMTRPIYFVDPQSCDSIDKYENACAFAAVNEALRNQRNGGSAQAQVLVQSNKSDDDLKPSLLKQLQLQLQSRDLKIVAFAVFQERGIRNLFRVCIALEGTTEQS